MASFSRRLEQLEQTAKEIETIGKSERVQNLREAMAQTSPMLTAVNHPVIHNGHRDTDASGEIKSRGGDSYIRGELRQSRGSPR